MDNLSEMRKKTEDGSYDLTIEIAENEFYKMYEDADNKSGEMFIQNYLIENSDDGDYKDVELKYNKNKKTICITAKLEYDNTEHKTYNNGWRMQ